MIDPVQERAALMVNHRQDRPAHFKTNPEMLAEHQGEDFIYVGKGEVTHISRAEFTKSFAQSFRQATY